MTDWTKQQTKRSTLSSLVECVCMLVVFAAFMLCWRLPTPIGAWLIVALAFAGVFVVAGWLARFVQLKLGLRSQWSHYRDSDVSFASEKARLKTESEFFETVMKVRDAHGAEVPK